MSSSAFTGFLEEGVARGGFQTDDALAAVLPLMREVVAIHDEGRVAPLRGLSGLAVNEGRALGLVSAEGIEPASNSRKLRDLLAPASKWIEVVGESRHEADDETHLTRVSNLDVASAGEAIMRPVFLPGHVGWENVIGHHDELADIHSLGMLLASLCCGLDFTGRDDLEEFANSRRNLFALAPRLHPVVAAVVVEMTELHRGKRSGADLATVIRTLETYRDQPVDEDVNRLPGLDAASAGGRRRIIQTHLRDRLFEVSRRNRLLYFKSSQSTLNLTTSSVPLVLDYRNIRPDQLLYWHDSLAADLREGRSLPLGKWLRSEEAPYLPGQLDKLIGDARRSRAEYGFSQLRLVLAFLRWNSFLTQCARNLPSTLLAWHYRSRYEALISFSNASFYGGSFTRFPTASSRRRRAGSCWSTPSHRQGNWWTPCSRRPISYIRCTGAPYENRRNPTEAAAVARLVRGILLKETKLSIGVAAFSEAQQGEVEAALDALAAEDPDFATRLEAEYVREEDDQFCGLFVKNLENVQGDERDIILMSVCYAPDAEGKMRMNFGPINQRGGEKRLNVIFSRARQHMVLVGSIRHTAITNDYNDGARALKNFLQYAESLSRGEPAMARQVLDGLNPLKRKSLVAVRDLNLVAGQIAAALEQRGWTAETGVGQSRFRCDVAVRARGADRHQLAILVDGGGSFDVAERFHTRPEILRAFGWQVALVMPKDWWHEPQSILDRIERLLRREVSDEPQPAEEDFGDEVEERPASPPAPEADPVAPVGVTTDHAFKRFELIEGKSSKFWEIRRDGLSLDIRFGRIGTNGQSRTKTFTDEARAARELAKLIAEKAGKGYVEAK